VATAKELTMAELRQLEASVSVVLRKGDDMRADLGRVVRSLLRGRAKAGKSTKGARIPVRVRSLIADMAPGFLAARRDEVASIPAALERGELDAIRVMGHNMKGTGSGYGFTLITEIGARLEEAAREGNRDDIRKLTKSLGDYLDRVEVIPE
jgi:Hpt domain-containing protein